MVFLGRAADSICSVALAATNDNVNQPFLDSVRINLYICCMGCTIETRDEHIGRKIGLSHLILFSPRFLPIKILQSGDKHKG